MRFSTLNAWLEWQETLHWQDIDLGLTRIKQVAQRLHLNSIAKHTIIVAGTNGKGSTVAYYSQFLRASGFSVGCYTSPHLLRYNERIAINLSPASDEQIMQAFHQIDEARQDISLSYFEFGTLAALLCIQQAQVDVAILEVGLGGRLDAVNIVDADLMHFTPIGIDHTHLLGKTRELIAIEKAGVLRPQCQVVCNDKNPPNSLVKRITKQAKVALYLNADYFYDESSDAFMQESLQIPLSTLSLVGEHQRLNCCGVLAGLTLLNHGDYFKQSAILKALSQITNNGRFQTVVNTKKQKTIVDVGHNADAADVLAQQLKAEAPSYCVMILGMLKDKDAAQFSAKLAKYVDHCICLDLQGDRALSADELSAKISNNKMTADKASTMVEALQKAEVKIVGFNKQAIILVTGSFYTVESYFKHSLQAS